MFFDRLNLSSILKRSNGTKTLGAKNEEADNWFAICDPFAKDISAVQTEIGKDQIFIVGALRERLPVWLYNTNPDFEPVGEEGGLPAHRHKIDSIRCYKKFNTGYLIGERVRAKMDLRQETLVECDFGTEFPNPKDDKTLIVTSVILSLMAENGARNIVFGYHRGKRHGQKHPAFQSDKTGH